MVSYASQRYYLDTPFSGILPEVLDVRARLVNEAMKIVAAERLTALVSDRDLQDGQIIPPALNLRGGSCSGGSRRQGGDGHGGGPPLRRCAPRPMLLP